MTINNSVLPVIIAGGPIVRKAINKQLIFWLVTSQQYNCCVTLYDENEKSIYSATLTDKQHACITVGKHAFINLLNIHLTDELPDNTWVSYNITLKNNTEAFSCTELKNLCYENQTYPRFWYSKKANHVLHGSCRKPHHKSSDGLLAVDNQIANALKGESVAPLLY